MTQSPSAIQIRRIEAQIPTLANVNDVMNLGRISAYATGKA